MLKFKQEAITEELTWEASRLCKLNEDGFTVPEFIDNVMIGFDLTFDYYLDYIANLLEDSSELMEFYRIKPEYIDLLKCYSDEDATKSRTLASMYDTYYIDGFCSTFDDFTFDGKQASMFMDMLTKADN